MTPADYFWKLTLISTLLQINDRPPMVNIVRYFIKRSITDHHFTINIVLKICKEFYEYNILELFCYGKILENVMNYLDRFNLLEFFVCNATSN